MINYYIVFSFLQNKSIYDIMELDKEDFVMENKKGLIIGIVVVVIVAVIAIIGCIAIKSGSKNIVGTYELVSMVNEGEEISEDDIALMKSFGLYVTLELKEDKTGVMSMFGEEFELTYDKNNFVIDDETCPYTVSDETITLEQGEDKLVFQKVDPSTLENANTNVQDE